MAAMAATLAAEAADDNGTTAGATARATDGDVSLVLIRTAPSRGDVGDGVAALETGELILLAADGETTAGVVDPELRWTTLLWGIDLVISGAMRCVAGLRE